MFPGFNNKKRSSIGGDFDGDGVSNRRDCQPMNWKKQDYKCINCGKNIPNLEAFPGPKCIDCYENDYNKELKRTGVMPKPDFSKALNI